jgi:hypothetical protein
MSIFDRENQIQRDMYLDHMRRTMEWIDNVIRQKWDPNCRDHNPFGSGYQIAVEARWLQQLIAENIAHYQTTQTLMQRLGELAHWSSMRYGSVSEAQPRDAQTDGDVQRVPPKS